MEANPLMTVTVTVPRSLDLAVELVTVGRGGTPELRDFNARVANAIVTAHERSPFPISLSRTNVSTRSSTG